MKAARKLNLVEAINMALRQEMEKDERIILLGEDIGYEGGVFRVTAGLQQQFGAERVTDTPLSESGIIGTSFGLAIGGMIPIPEIQFDGFLYPAYDQIISHVGRIRNRSRGNYTCPMVLRVTFGGGIKAPEHHSESPESMLAHTPGIKVVIPSTPYDAKGLLISAIRDPDPVIFLEPKRIYRAIRQEVPEEEYTVPIGKARIVQEGDNVTLIAWGAMVREAERAALLVQKEGISVEIIDLRSITPMDTEVLIASANKTGRVVIAHEAPRTAGLASEIATRIMEKAFLSLQAPIERVTGFDVPMPLAKGEDYFLPDQHRIARAIRKVINF